MVKLVKIFGHAGITGNVIADLRLKKQQRRLLTGNLKHRQQFP